MWRLWYMVKSLQVFSCNSQGEKVEWFYICHECSTFSSHATTAIAHEYIYIFLAALHVIWDFSSPTRDGTRAPCIGRQSLIHLDRWGIPYCSLLSLWLFAVFSFLCHLWYPMRTLQSCDAFCWSPSKLYCIHNTLNSNVPKPPCLIPITFLTLMRGWCPWYVLFQVGEKSSFVF